MGTLTIAFAVLVAGILIGLIVLQKNRRRRARRFLRFDAREGQPRTAAPTPEQRDRGAGPGAAAPTGDRRPGTRRPALVIGSVLLLIVGSAVLWFFSQTMPIPGSNPARPGFSPPRFDVVPGMQMRYHRMRSRLGSGGEREVEETREQIRTVVREVSLMHHATRWACLEVAIDGVDGAPPSVFAECLGANGSYARARQIPQSPAEPVWTREARRVTRFSGEIEVPDLSRTGVSHDDLWLFESPDGNLMVAVSPRIGKVWEREVKPLKDGHWRVWELVLAAGPNLPE